MPTKLLIFIRLGRLNSTTTTMAVVVMIFGVLLGIRSLLWNTFPVTSIDHEFSNQVYLTMQNYAPKMITNNPEL